MSSFKRDTFKPKPILLQAQKVDPALSFIYTWLKQKQKIFTSTPNIKSKSLLYT